MSERRKRPLTFREKQKKQRGQSLEMRSEKMITFDKEKVVLILKQFVILIHYYSLKPIFTSDFLSCFFDFFYF